MKKFLLLFLTVLAGSCGGGDDDPAGAPPPIVDPGPGPGPAPAPVPQLTWIVQGSGTELDFTQVTAVDADHAWAVSRDRLHRTVDGGVNWIDVGMEFPGYIHDVHFFDPLNGWALVAHYLYSTADGGDTWVARAFIDGWPYFNSMSFLDMNTGWVALSRDEIWRTTDGGASWTTSTFAPGVGGRSVAAVEFVDSQVGWLLTFNLAGSVAGAEVLKTTDGGASWTPQLALAGSGHYFNDIAALSPTVAWVVETMTAKSSSPRRTAALRGWNRRGTPFPSDWTGSISSTKARGGPPASRSSTPRTAAPRGRSRRCRSSVSLMCSSSTPRPDGPWVKTGSS